MNLETDESVSELVAPEIQELLQYMFTCLFTLDTVYKLYTAGAWHKFLERCNINKILNPVYRKLSMLQWWQSGIGRIVQVKNEYTISQNYTFLRVESGQDLRIFSGDKLLWRLICFSWDPFDYEDVI